MSLRTFVTFQWQAPAERRRSPDDSVLIAPPDMEIVFYLRDYLNQRGFTTTRPYSDHGSDLAFGIESGGVRVCCVVKDGQPWLLATQVQGWSKISQERRDPLAEQTRVCAALHECLLNSGRATALSWYTRRDFECGRVETAADSP